MKPKTRLLKGSLCVQGTPGGFRRALLSIDGAIGLFSSWDIDSSCPPGKEILKGLRARKRPYQLRITVDVAGE